MTTTKLQDGNTRTRVLDICRSLAVVGYAYAKREIQDEDVLFFLDVVEATRGGVLTLLEIRQDGAWLIGMRWLGKDLEALPREKLRVLEYIKLVPQTELKRRQVREIVNRPKRNNVRPLRSVGNA